MTCKIEVLNVIASIFPNMTVIEFIELLRKQK